MKLNALMWIPLIASAVLFCAVAYFTRADGRRVLSALIGGALASGVGLFLDVCGYWTGLWYYQGAYVSHGPWLVYVAVAFVQGAVALFSWHLTQRFSNMFLVFFVFFVASVLTSQDYLIANSPFRVQIISRGLAPAVYDQMLWLLVTTVSVWTLRVLSGAARAETGEPSDDKVTAH
jgi:hypothetical protein